MNFLRGEYEKIKSEFKHEFEEYQRLMISQRFKIIHKIDYLDPDKSYLPILDKNSFIEKSLLSPEVTDFMTHIKLRSDFTLNRFFSDRGYVIIHNLVNGSTEIRMFKELGLLLVLRDEHAIIDNWDFIDFNDYAHRLFIKEHNLPIISMIYQTNN